MQAIGPGFVGVAFEFAFQELEHRGDLALAGLVGLSGGLFRGRLHLGLRWRLLVRFSLNENILRHSLSGLIAPSASRVEQNSAMILEIFR
jgi:hypothetical protein